jgi:hypothetical protein
MKTSSPVPSLVALVLALGCASSSSPLSSSPDAGGGAEAGAAGAGAAGAGSAGAGAVDSGSAGKPNDAAADSPVDVAVAPAEVGADAALGCLALTAPTVHGETMYKCALPQPCDVVVYHGLDGPGGYPPAATITLPAAQCVLQHLRDAVSSHLTLDHPNSVGYDDTNFWVQRDGSVIYERHYRLDLGNEDYGPRRFRVKPKAFFDACLLETDPKTVYGCLTGWWIDDACFPAGDLPCAP